MLSKTMKTGIVDVLTVDPDVLKPRFLGFCIGVPGDPCGRRVYDDEIEAVQLERRYYAPEIRQNPKVKDPVIGKCCYPRLFPLVALKPQTASQHLALKKKAGKASARVPANRLKVRPEDSKPRPKGVAHSRRGRHANTVEITLPGSEDFRGKEKPGPDHWRQYGVIK